MSYKKIFIIFIFLLLAGVTLYNSVYFENLQARKLKSIVKISDPETLVHNFWKNNLDSVLKSALNLKTFDSLLVKNPEILRSKYGRKIGITSSYSFLVQGSAKYLKEATDKIPVGFPGSKNYSLLIKYIFSNTARDATGYFKVNDFENTMDFNEVSSEINKMIRDEVIAHKFDSLSIGALIEFTGAIDVNIDSPAKEIDIVPLRITIIQ